MFDLHVKNFRGFADQGFRFGKVNILIGENSGGKSSVIKLLLAMKQSLSDPSEVGGFNLTLSGRETDLGTFRDVIHHHSTRRRLGIGFTTDEGYTDFLLNRTGGTDLGFWRTPNKRLSEIPRPLRKQIQNNAKEARKAFGYFLGTPVQINYSFSKNLNAPEELETVFTNDVIGNLRIKIEEISEEPSELSSSFLSGHCTLIFENGKGGSAIELKKIPFKKDAFLTIIHSASLRHAISTANSEGSAVSFDELAYLLESQAYIATRLYSLEYVNPLLSEPAERIYLRGPDKKISNLSDINKLVSFLSGPSQDNFLKGLNDALKTFGIVEKVYLDKKDYTTEVRVVQNGVESNLKDVGFGVSLQIPIFAQALKGNLSQWGQAMIIEQPEVHLHPKLQSTFIDALLTVTNDQPIFIETHSEHIVRMLQLIVKEGRHGLKSDDVAIHYFGRDGEKQKVTRHDINQETGRLEPPFPPGFYDVSYSLAFKLMN